MERNYVISFVIRITLVIVRICTFAYAYDQQKRNTFHKKKNILFIATDDLWPELACYAMSQLKIPNIDKLAQQGSLFENFVKICYTGHDDKNDQQPVGHGKFSWSEKIRGRGKRHGKPVK